MSALTNNMIPKSSWRFTSELWSGAERHQWTLCLLFFFPKKNDTWWLSLAKVGIEAFWIRSGSSSLTLIRVEKSRCGSWSLPWWDIRHRSAGFSASRNIFGPWLQQINYHKISFGSELFFLSHTTSSHLDAQSDFIQDTGCASSIFNSRVARRLIFL